MIVPTFVDLQEFIVGKKFIAKEVAVLKRKLFFHFIFTCSMPWNFLTKSEKFCASWLSVYHHGLQWEDGIIPHSMIKRLIMMAVIDAKKNDDNKSSLKDVKIANGWLLYSIATTRQVSLWMLITKI